MNPSLRDELRQIALFTDLKDDQIVCLEAGEEFWAQPGEVLVEEGDPIVVFYVLLEGAVEFSKRIAEQDVHVVTFGDGSFFGHEPMLLEIPVPVTGRVIQPSRLFRLQEDDFWRMLTQCPSTNRELLRTIAQRLQNLETVSQQHGKLIALGTLSAGLAHELNNPAAAVSRAANCLDQVLQTLPVLALQLHQGHLSADEIAFLSTLQQEAVVLAKSRPTLDPLAESDRQDEVGDWLDQHGIQAGWKLAPILVEAGLDIPWLDQISHRIPITCLSDVLTWLGASLNAVTLLGEVAQGSTRISDLVKAIKEYSYRDQAPSQEVDIHDGLESTLTILSHKLKHGVDVTRDYDRHLPRISAYGSELNQVWTNLIDNAIDAMNGKGHLWIRTFLESDRLVVEIQDEGPGIPVAIQNRIFDQFFTTKEVGKGTGLGLDIVRRIVQGRHHGDIRLTSKPGETRFQVRLPLG